MAPIPVTFEHNGKTYKATFYESFFDKDCWYLRDNMGDHLGRLYRFPDRWEFYEGEPGNNLAELKDYFIQVVIAWYE
jgi:hypothetical protein